MNKILLKNLAIVLLLGMIGSLVPFLHISMILGFPAVVVSTILVGIVFNKELSKEN